MVFSKYNCPVLLLILILKLHTKWEAGQASIEHPTGERLSDRRATKISLMHY